MSTTSLSQIIARQAAWNMKNSSARLGESILRLSSGLRISKPSDGAYEYIRASRLASDVRIYESIKTGLTEYKSILTIGEEAAAEIRDKLERMQELATQASGVADASERGALWDEFDSLRSGVSSLVTGTQYDGKGILNESGYYNQTRTLYLNPDRSASLTIDLNKLDVSDAAATLPVGDNGIQVRDDDWGDAVNGQTYAQNASTDVNYALQVVDNFLSEVSGKQTVLDSQINVSDSLIENYNAAQSSLVGVDESEELVNYTAQDVRTQAATAMLGQANLAQKYVLKLYEFHYS